MTRTIIVWQGQGANRKRVAGAFTREAALRKARTLGYKNAHLARRGGYQLGYDGIGGFIYIDETKAALS